MANWKKFGKRAGIGAGIVAGGVAALPFAGSAMNYLANREEGKAAEKAARKEREVAQGQADKLEAAGERGAYLLGGATEKSKNEIRDYSGMALGDTRRGYGNARASLGDFYTQSRGDVGAGYGRGQSQLTDAYGQTRNALELGRSRSLGGLDSARGTLTPFIDDRGSRLAALYDSGSLNNFGDFQADPGYQFRLEQGMKALERKRAAMGGRLGGDALKELMDYNSGLASQEYGNFANRQLALRGQQIGAAGGVDQQQIGLRGRLADLYQAGSGIEERFGGNMATAAGQYGASSAGLSTAEADRLSGLASQHGANLSNLYTGEANQLANINQGLGSNLANLTMRGAEGQSSALTAGAGGSAKAIMSTLPTYSAGVPYAGGEYRALGQGFGDMQQAGMLALSMYGAPGAAAPRPGQGLPTSLRARYGGGTGMYSS